MDNVHLHIVHRINASIDCSRDNLQKVNDLNISDVLKSVIDELEVEFNTLGKNRFLHFQEISVDIEISSNQLYDLKNKIKDALLKKIKGFEIDEDIKEEADKMRKARHFSPIEILLFFLNTGTLLWDS